MHQCAVHYHCQLLDVFFFWYAASCMDTHLQRLVLQVHLEQRVSHQVSETTAVEVAVGPSVAPAVVDLRELQAAVLLQVVSMEVLVLAEHLSEAGHKEGGKEISSRRRSRPFSEAVNCLGISFLQGTSCVFQVSLATSGGLRKSLSTSMKQISSKIPRQVSLLVKSLGKFEVLSPLLFSCQRVQECTA